MLGKIAVERMMLFMILNALPWTRHHEVICTHTWIEYAVDVVAQIKDKKDELSTMSFDPATIRSFESYDFLIINKTFISGAFTPTDQFCKFFQEESSEDICVYEDAG